jgi:hypothetical protein
MAFPSGCYDPETLHVMTYAFDAAWNEAEYALASNNFDPAGLRRLIAIRITARLFR